MEVKKDSMINDTKQDLRSKNLQEKAERSGNEVRLISWKRKLVEIVILLVSGMLMSTAFPSLNWNVIAWIGLVPLYLLVMNKTMFQAWRAGFIWGYGFSVTAFFWFREIEFFLPYIIAPILALFPAFWAMVVPAFRRGLLIPVEVQLKGHEEVDKYNEQRIRHEILFALVLASWWCVTEWIRGWIGTGLPWNYLSATQWRNLPLIQICEFTGTYGVSFVIALVNVTLAMACVGFYKTRRNGKLRRPVPFVISLFLTIIVVIVGSQSAKRHVVPDGEEITFTAAVLQGDISQRRHADARAAAEALDKYLALSEEAAKLKPGLIIWPETAVPYAFRAMNLLCYRYRMEVAALIKKYKIPFLIGTIDFEDLPPGAKRKPGVMNSAFLIDNTMGIKAKFSKVHIVPFGEFVPFRKYLPGFVAKAIDMGRDLVRGTSFEPIEVYPGVHAGMSICFEDVFAYVAREEARLGANMLLVITNDAWYPTSAEPEQHLACSVFRAVETRLPIVRCGNNSASCLIEPNGRIADSIFKHKNEKTGKYTLDLAKRGEGIAKFTVVAARNPKKTFYTRFGDVFVMVCIFIVVWGFSLSVWSWRKRVTALKELFD